MSDVIGVREPVKGGQDYGTAVDRMLDFIDPAITEKVVLVIGCGAVGRRAALLLASVGVRLVLCDHDDVEVHNIGPQGWRVRDVGRKKVDVLAEECLEAGSPSVKVISDRWSGQWDGPLPAGVVVAVDSMNVRREIVTWWATKADSQDDWDSQDSRDKPTLVEARMSALYCAVRVIRSLKDESAWYDDWYPDEECIQVPCTGRATAWTACFAAATVVGLLLAAMSGRDLHTNKVEWTCQDWADWAGGKGERLVVS